MAYAKVFKVSGEIVDVVPANGCYFTLDELKGFIGGGHIQVVPIGSGERCLVCDDDGKFKDFAINRAATQKFYPDADFIVGDVLICDVALMD